MSSKSMAPIAVLSFLGFDGISTLAEESTGKKNLAGRAMVVSLFIVAFLFITQTWPACSRAAGSRSATTRRAMRSSIWLKRRPARAG
jgi:hypothetical protein